MKRQIIMVNIYVSKKKNEKSYNKKKNIYNKNKIKNFVKYHVKLEQAKFKIINLLIDKGWRKFLDQNFDLL